MQGEPPATANPDRAAGVPLLLLCAAEGEAALLRLADALRRDGCAPEVIAGVDADPALISAATDRIVGPALFIVCRGRELDRSQVLRLRGLFSARRGPLHRLLVVDLSARDPLAARPTIHAALADAAERGRASPPAAEADRVPTRDVVRVAGLGRAGLGAVPGRSRPDGGGAANPETKRYSGVPAPITDDEEPLSVLHREPNAFGRSEAEPLEAEPLESESLEVEAIESDPLPAEPTPTPTPPRARPRRSPADAPAVRANSRTNGGSHRSWIALLVGLAGLAALAGMAALQVTGDGAGIRGAPGVVAPATSAAGGAPAGPPAPDAGEQASKGKTAGAAGEGESSRPADPAGPLANPEPPTRPSSVPPPPLNREAVRVERALRSGRIRMSDAWLVARATAREVDWDTAHHQCSRLRIEGLKGWRLPSLRELGRLRRARLVGSGVYWSSDVGEAPDEAYAVDTTTGARIVYMKIEPVARMQCVRKREGGVF